MLRDLSRRIALVAALAVAAVPTTITSQAWADPTGSPHAISVVLICNGQPTSIVIPSPNALTPRIIVNGQEVLIPKTFSIVITDLTINQVIFNSSSVQGNGAVVKATVLCSDTFTQVDPVTGDTLLFQIVSQDMPV